MLDKEKQDRKRSAIVHLISESLNTHNTVLDILDQLGFHRDSVENISRLGRRPMGADNTMTKPRPTKIQFRTETMKIDFLAAFNRWEDRNGSFSTPDLSKDDQLKEYQLRSKKRNLSTRHPDCKFRIKMADCNAIKTKCRWKSTVTTKST